MNGIEKISQKILAEAQERAADITAEAEREAKGLLDEARAAAERECADMRAAAEKRVQTASELAQQNAAAESRGAASVSDRRKDHSIFPPFFMAASTSTSLSAARGCPLAAAFPI